MRQVCDLVVWTAQLQLVLLGTILQWPTGTLLSVVGRRMINLGTTGWRRSTDGRRLFHPTFLTCSSTWG